MCNDFRGSRSYLTRLNTLHTKSEIWRRFLICLGCVNGSPLESAQLGLFGIVSSWVAPPWNIDLIPFYLASPKKIINLSDLPLWATPLKILENLPPPPPPPNCKEVKRVMIIDYDFLSYVIFDQQLKITFRKSSTPPPLKKSTPPFYSPPPPRLPSKKIKKYKPPPPLPFW